MKIPQTVPFCPPESKNSKQQRRSAAASRPPLFSSCAASRAKLRAAASTARPTRLSTRSLSHLTMQSASLSLFCARRESRHSLSPGNPVRTPRARVNRAPGPKSSLGVRVVWYCYKSLSLSKAKLKKKKKHSSFSRASQLSQGPTQHAWGRLHAAMPRAGERREGRT